MPLTIKRVEKSQFGGQIKALVAAEPGSGKTRFASTWPDVLYAATEDAGLLSVADRNPAYIDIEHSADLEALRMVLAKPPEEREKHLGVPVQTVILDTIDGIQRIFIRERLAAEKKATLAIQDFGWLGDQLRNLVRGFRNLDLNVLFTSHIKTDKDEETGRVYLKPALQGAMSDELPAYVDLAMVIRQRSVAKVVDGQTQKVTVRVGQVGGDQNIPWLKDRTGTLPAEFEMDLEKDFARIHRAMFGKPKQGATAEAPAPAPAEPQGAQPAAAPDPSAGADDQGGQEAEGPQAAAAEEPQASEGAPAADQAGAPGPAPDAVQAQSEEAAAAPGAQAPEEAPAAAPTESPAEESVPEAETPPVAAEGEAPVDGAEPLPDCSGCGKQVESEDQRDLSLLRYRQPLCRACLKAKKAA